MVAKAQHLYEIPHFFRTTPLTLKQLPDYYVKAAPARGKNPIVRIQNLLRYMPDENLHILFVGYKGCGKSTELNRLQSQLQDEFLIINFSVLQQLDPVNLHYIELFIVTMEQLFDIVVENDLPISQAYMNSIKFWAQTKEVAEIRDKHFSIEGEAGSEFGIPWFKTFFTKFKAAAKSSKSVKETIKKNIEPRLSELLEQCNALIREIRFNLKRIDENKKDILFIIEDLDKIPPDRASNLFYQYANQLTALDAHIIYTFPIALFFNTQFNTIRNFFQENFVLPMIKIKNKDGQPNPAGRQTLRDIVEKRMDLNLFADEKLLENMIDYSGGCIRDLFRMISEAAGNAQEFEREKIIEEDWIEAYQNLKMEYDSTIADKIDMNSKDEKVLIPVEDYYEALVNLTKSIDKKPENTQEVLDLRQNLTILGYNGEGWCDVHPIVYDILKERGKLS